MHVKSDKPSRPASCTCRKNSFTNLPVHGAPIANASLQRPPGAEYRFGVSPPRFFKNGDRSEAGSSLEHRHDHFIEDTGQGIGSAPTAWGLPLCWQPAILQNALARRWAESRLRRRQSDGVITVVGHEKSHLMIVDLSTGHTSGPHLRKTRHIWATTTITGTSQRVPPVCRDRLRVTPSADPNTPDSHLDCRDFSPWPSRDKTPTGCPMWASQSYPCDYTIHLASVSFPNALRSS